MNKIQEVQKNLESFTKKKTLTALIRSRTALSLGRGVGLAVFPLERLSTVLNGTDDIAPHTVAVLTRFLGRYRLAVVIDSGVVDAVQGAGRGGCEDEASGGVG